ncbi:MAG: DUF554 domain-containing protein [Herpetosiphon sp.]
MPVGTAINVLTVLAGTLIGVLLGNRLPERMRETATIATGLVSLALGFQMGVQTHNILVTLGSLAAGGIAGEWWRLDDRLNALGNWVEARVVSLTQRARTKAASVREGQAEGSIARAFVTASLLFCVGPITVLGAIQDGSGNYQLLAIKALLDGIVSIALASSLGWGVGLAALTVLIFQGFVTLTSKFVGQEIGSILAERTIRAGGQLLPLGSTMVAEMTAAGGLMIVAIGLLLLDVKRIRVANFLPSLVAAPAIVLALHWLRVPLAP